MISNELVLCFFRQDLYYSAMLWYDRPSLLRTVLIFLPPSILAAVTVAHGTLDWVYAVKLSGPQLYIQILDLPK